MKKHPEKPQEFTVEREMTIDELREAGFTVRVIETDEESKGKGSWSKSQAKGSLGSSIQTGQRGVGHTEESARPIENVIIKKDRFIPKKP